MKIDTYMSDPRLVISDDELRVYVDLFRWAFEHLEDYENIDLIPLATSSFNSFCTAWDGDRWVEAEDAPKSVVAVCSQFYEGRVIGLCTVSMFSSLSSAYKQDITQRSLNPQVPYPM